MIMTSRLKGDDRQAFMNRYEKPQAGRPETRYSAGDLNQFYYCLNHQTVTQFTAFDPSGENYPVNRYVNRTDGLETLVNRTAGKYVVTVGLNERPTELLNEYGYPRAAKDRDINCSQHVLLDFDNVATNISSTLRYQRHQYFLNEYHDHFRDQGCLPPSLVIDSGSGIHVIHSYPVIPVAEHPDIVDRLRKFYEETETVIGDETDRLGLKLDRSKANLCTLIKVPSTAKPGGIQSRLLYARRHEDEQLRIHLLSMRVEPKNQRYSPIYGASLLTINNDNYHPIVQALLRRDFKLRSYANKKGKPKGTDTSRSGYLYSFAQRLIILGVRDLDILGSSLAVLAEQFGKQVTEENIRRTIAAALVGRKGKE